MGIFSNEYIANELLPIADLVIAAHTAGEIDSAFDTALDTSVVSYFDLGRASQSFEFDE